MIKRILFQFVVVAITGSIAACSSNSNEKSANVPGYDLKKPITINLKTSLDEISGLQYYAKDTAVFAIIDELGILFKIYLRDPIKVTEWNFARNSDYEDLTLIDSNFYILQSSGKIVKTRFFPEGPTSSQQYDLNLNGKNEFETLYYDEAERKLVSICKECKEDDKNSVSAYSFDVNTESFSEEPYFKLDAKEILDHLPKDKSKQFKPSAAAIHPITQDLYILSSINRALVITDRKGKFKEAYSLSAKIFKMPEGITFTPSGDMLICNEAADIGTPNVLIFKYKS